MNSVAERRREEKNNNNKKTENNSHCRQVEIKCVTITIEMWMKY